jgi:outer membrane protein assembly factor BamB
MQKSPLLIFLIIGSLVIASLVTGQQSHPEMTVHGTPKSLRPGTVVSDWTSFLGPNHDGSSPETNLRQEFGSDGPPLVWEWKTGIGYASPAIKGDRLVYIHRVSDEEVVECIHAVNGRRFWKVSDETDYKDRYGFNGGPRSSPVIDGDRVYTHGVQGILQCIELNSGKVIWKRNTDKDYNKPQEFFGVGSTPLIDGDLLIVNVGAPGGPGVIGINKLTGKTEWESKNDWGASYASPIPADIHGKHRVLVFAGGDSEPPTGGLLMIDPADGSIDCTYPFRSKKYESVNAASPVVFDNKVFLTTSYRTGGDLLGFDSDVRCSKIWSTNALRSHFSTPIHRDGFIYGFDGMGSGECKVVCINATTGNEVWREQPKWSDQIVLEGKAREVINSIDRGSLLMADDQFICLGEHGHLLLLELSPSGLRVKSRAFLFSASETWTLPVLSKGLLYVRQNQKSTIDKSPPRLLCYDLRAP